MQRALSSSLQPAGIECESRRGLALSPAAGVEAARAHPILRRSAISGLRESYRRYRCGGGQERQQDGNGAG